MDRTCKNCSETFTIDQSDEDFIAQLSSQFEYLPIPIPLPTHCPLCRLNRRLAFRNMNFISWGEEFDTKERLFTFYPGGAPFPILSNERWWKEDYAVPVPEEKFDASRSFFNQFLALRNQVPHPALNVKGSENSDYCNNANDLQNCYMVFGANRVRDTSYSEAVVNCNDCIDCLQTFNSELCVDCSRCSDCYSIQSSNLCFQCFDSYFLHNCRNCKNCIGCVNLNRKEYCIFNEQKTKAEYESYLASHDLKSFAVRQEIRKEFYGLIKSSQHANLLFRQAEDCTGNIIAEAKNVKDSFFIRDAEDLRYCFSLGVNSRAAMDVSYYGEGMELCYETAVTGKASSRIVFSFNCWSENHYLLYCELCVSCQHCFGCIGLQRKEYCIFNKQYSKEEYYKEISRIILGMEALGEWGEFFPMQLSPHAYNTTVAQRYFSKTKEEVNSLGLIWFEDNSLNAKDAVPAKDLPDRLPESNDSLVVASEKSGKLFRIASADIAKYRSLGAPLPRTSFIERMDTHVKCLGGLKPLTRSCAVTNRPLLTYFEESLYPIVVDLEVFNKEYFS
jgi:hypothetical protein